MGAIKNAMLAWMEEKNISPEQLKGMNNVNEQFSQWLSEKMIGKESQNGF